MKHLDLFSGIGGNSLAADWTWPDVQHTFCEIDPFCRKILRKHWPDSTIYEDITKLTWTEGPVDLVTGGFPCQPFSVAGKRKGKEDDRDLWPDMFRIIREARPRWVIGENNPGIIGMELDRSISDLESAGYSVQTFDIPAIAVDARHLRHRVWIVAHADRVVGRLSIQPQDRRPESESSFTLRGRTNVADTNKINGERSDTESQTGRAKSQERSAGLRSGGRRRDYAKWPAEPRIRRVAHGIPNRVDRAAALGNSIVPQVVAEIMRAIKAVDGSV